MHLSIYIIYLPIYLEKGDSSLVVDLDDQMESVRANINYLHDNILECQQNILQMEQAAGHSFIHSFIISLNHSFIHLFIHLFIYSFIYSFIHL